MDKVKIKLDTYKTKPEEFQEIMFGYLIIPGEHFVYLKKDEPEIDAMLEDEKQFIMIYDTKIQKCHIVKVEPLNELDSVLNQCPRFLRNELKVRFNKFEQDNSFAPDKENMVDIAIATMNEAQASVAKQTDEDIDKEVAEAKANLPQEPTEQEEVQDEKPPVSPKKKK